MVQFRKHIKKNRTVDPKDLPKLFESLDRQTSHTELRTAQLQALQELKRRRSERDLVLKISTGAGKTGVGLLWLLSHMEEQEEPAVYLCPTVQLVDQVLDEAGRIGISATGYRAREKHAGADAISGKSIIVCTYDKLFNAKTTFDRADAPLRPCAIVLDDAHAGLEEIRDAFTLRISNADLRKKLTDLFSPSCQKYKVGVWHDILNDDPSASLEIPYWIWRSVLHDVQNLLSSYALENDKTGDHQRDKAFVFVWPFLRDILNWCRCVVAGNGIELVPEVLPISKSRAYVDAKHRLFMSATLADDSTLVRDLGCAIESASKPIRPKADRGLGERMVIAPSLVDASLNRSWIMDQCARLSRKWRIVVLCPSEKMARDWEKHGALAFVGDNVGEAVRQLKDNQSELRFCAFAQRYDGVDLPDGACRILVIDGIPYGEGIADKYDSSFATDPGGVRSRLIYRLEQGMGRAVRSHVDYAVILLSGDDLANFIARKDVLRGMNPDTQAQLRLAMDLAKLAQEEGESDPGKTIVDMVNECLGRDEGWKQYYEENVRASTRKTKESNSTAPLKLAAAERESFELAIANRPEDAVRALQKALNEQQMPDTEEGWYLQQIAFYQHCFDPGQAIKTQASAHTKNNLLYCPPAPAPKAASVRRFTTQGKVLDWFRQFEHANGAIAAIQNLRSRLSYSVSSETMEQALYELAHLVGAIGSRPEREYGEGPDDLWLWPEISVVIEAKNGNEDSLHKTDAGQLLLSLQWFGRVHAGRNAPIPLIVAKIEVADRKEDFPPGTRVITPKKMSELLNQLESLFRQLAGDMHLMSQPHIVLDRQSALGLTPEQFISNFTIAIKKKP